MIKKLMVTKKIFSIITIVWSCLMLTQYLFILLPFWSESIFTDILLGYLIPALYLGIWIVPVFYLISVVFIIISKDKFDNTASEKVLNLINIILPAVLYVLMFSTNFLSTLA